MTPSGFGWFEEQLAAVPPVLQERLRIDIDPLAEHETVRAVADELAGTARMRVQPLWNTGGCTDRADALELLSLDALVTYTIGFVAVHLPDDMEMYTTRLLHAVADVAQRPPADPA